MFMREMIHRHGFSDALAWNCGRTGMELNINCVYSDFALRYLYFIQTIVLFWSNV